MYYNLQLRKWEAHMMVDTTELNEIITKLEAKDEIDTITIQKLWTISHLLHVTSEEDLPGKLERLQELNNLLYKENPEETLLIDLQVYINTIRNQYDITDPREIIHTDNGKGFVQ